MVYKTGKSESSRHTPRNGRNPEFVTGSPVDRPITRTSKSSLASHIPVAESVELADSTPRPLGEASQSDPHLAIEPGQNQYDTRDTAETATDYPPINQGSNRKTILGFRLPRDSGRINLEDYEIRYPPDEIGQEMGVNARVWRVYLDEAALNDRNMVEGWRNVIDGLLIFAGLFSAVITTFIVQVSQKLDQDNVQISASLLTELVAVQRAVATGSTLERIPTSTITFTSPAQPTNAAVWINALWFTSLVLSLATAFYSVLVRQWVQHYISFASGTPEERAQIHHFRYAGLQQWAVGETIGVLPILLYLAFFLFISGIVILLQELKPWIAWVVGAIGGVTFLLYILTSLLPLLFPQCPYRTPLVDLLYSVTSFGSRSLRDSELNYINVDADKIIHNILVWLLTFSSNPSVKPIALQAISGLRVGFTCIRELLGEGSLIREELLQELERHQSIALDWSVNPVTLIRSPAFYNTERILRAWMMMPNHRQSRCRPCDLIWSPRNWDEFDKRLIESGTSLAFQQAAATYRVNCMILMTQHTGIPRSPHEVLESLYPLSRLVDLVSLTPASWQAWSNTIKEGCFNREPILISMIYNIMGPLCLRLLNHQYSSEDSDSALLAFISHFMHQKVITKYGKTPTLRQDIDNQVKIRFGAIVLECIILEWNIDFHDSRAQSSLIAQVCHLIYWGWNSHSHNTGAITTMFRPILEGIIGHQGFVHSQLQRETYELVFSTYVGALNLYDPLSPAPKVLSSLEHVNSILGSVDCAHGLLGAIFHCDSITEPRLSALTNPLIQALREGRHTDDIVVSNLFDAFLGLPMVQGYLSNDSPRDDGYYLPFCAQHLIGLLLAYIIDHDGMLDSRLPVKATAMKLIERPGLLELMCSPLLEPGDESPSIHGDGPLLVRLAQYHRDKPGAADTWRAFLSSISKQLAEKHNIGGHADWKRSDFENHERMANLVDQLTSTLGLEGPNITTPRFQEGYIIGFLREYKSTICVSQYNDDTIRSFTQEPSRKTSVFHKFLLWRTQPVATFTSRDGGPKEKHKGVGVV